MEKNTQCTQACLRNFESVLLHMHVIGRFSSHCNVVAPEYHTQSEHLRKLSVLERLKERKFWPGMGGNKSRKM